MRSVHLAVVTVLVLVAAFASRGLAGQAPGTPRQAADDLLAADRAFAASSAQQDVVSGLSAMFADGVVLPLPGGQFARGAAAARAALAGNAENLTSRVEWSPVRAGVSADGQHGFTFGYMTLTRADKTRMPLRYLAYWVRQRDGWRVVAYKRGRASDPPGSPAMMPPALPVRIVPVVSDAAAIARHRESLDAAERSFSDEAQKIGIGPAFVKYGSADAVNMGPPTEPRFLVGSEAIGRSVGSNYTPDQPGVSWAPDSVIVASSGDLGVTIGLIRSNGPGPDGKVAGPFAFFTIWRRATPESPWRYVAE